MAESEWHVWLPYRDEPCGNLAVFCSAERFVAATLEFLRRSLSLERCDLLVLPGGPAFIAEKNAPFVARLKFLVTEHALKRIVLVTHENCAYYRDREHDLAPEALKARQCDEARAAAEMLEKAFPGVTVDAILAGRDAWGFVFTKLNTKG
jgi:hypothetical protein